MTHRRSAALILVLLLAPPGTGARAAAQGADISDPNLRVPVEHWGCTNCHLPDATTAERVGRRPGPDLGEVGERASAAWMRRWIARPADLRAAPTMPRLFGTTEQEEADLDAVVAFLSSRGAPAGGAAATEESVLTAGRELYHTVGCVHCHGALDSPAEVFGDEFLPQEVPQPFVFSTFSDLEGKWYPAALSAFLLDPTTVHRDGRMPGMNLEPFEADLLASYLLSKFPAAKDGADAADTALVIRGREVFAERGCQACHTVGELEFPAHPAPPLAELLGEEQRGGCLSPDEWDGPRYDFPAPALAGMLTGGLMAVTHAKVSDARLDYLERQVNRLNCQACHEIDGVGGVQNELRIYCTSLDEEADLGDEGRIPPHLNGVGGKLTTSWFHEVLFESGRARPYVATRMPQYGDAVKDFPELFARRAGVEPHSDLEWPAVSDELVLAGRDMMGMEAAACVSCHSFRDLPAVGTPGPDMSRFAGRLRYAWWNEYIKDPAAFKPGTRMPLFRSEDGSSVFEHPFDGDFQRQTDAMWAYFTLGELMPPPEGMGKPGGMMLTVGETPRVFRTFIRGVGPRGIAVGFPVGLHYAYDAGQARLMQVWQGEFLDASGAWAGRGGNSRKAAGEELWEHPGGPAFVIGDKPQSWPARAEGVAFKGYRVGSEGGPVFQYTVTLEDGAEVQVVEQTVPRLSPEKVLERRFVFQGVPQGASVWLRTGGEVTDARIQGTGAHGPSDGTGGEMWYRFAPSQSTSALILEVAL